MKIPAICLLLMSPLLQGAEPAPAEQSSMATYVHSTSEAPSQYRITCMASPTFCTEEANRLCPLGFGIENYIKEIREHEQMTIIVKCKDDGS